MFVSHALQVAELHTLLHEADRSQAVELLEPACWRSYGQTQTLKPDSYARLGVGAFEDSFFLEVDRGTEGSRTLERQLKTYVAFREERARLQREIEQPRSPWLKPKTV